MERKISNLTKKYSFSQAYYWIVFMITLEYSSMFLSGSDVTNSRIGLLLSVSGVLAAVLQPAAATYADKPESPSVKKFLYIFTVLMLTLSTLLLFRYTHEILLLILYGSWIIALEIMTPFHHSLATESINQRKRLDIGFTRGIASLACGAISFLLGALSDRFDVRILPLTVLILLVFYLINIFRFPFAKTPVSQKNIRTHSGTASAESEKTGIGHTGKRIRDRNVFSFFLQYRRFSISLAGCTLLYICQVLMMNFSYQITVSKGGSFTESGIAIAIGALAEIPVMFGFVWMMRRRRAGFWVIASGFFYIAKALGSLLVSDITGFYLVQLLQMLSWALLSVSVVYYVNDVMHANDTIKGQAYMTATYSIAVVIGSLLGGLMLDHAGVSAMLILAMLAAVIGTILNLISIPLLKKR